MRYFPYGDTPYADLQNSEVLQFVSNGHRLWKPSTTTPETVIGLIRDFTQMNVARRPLTLNVLKWLTKPVDDPAERGKMSRLSFDNNNSAPVIAREAFVTDRNDDETVL